MAESTFDIKFIAINQIAYTFNKLASINSNDDNRESLIGMAIECLALMEQYQTLHPSYTTLLAYLAAAENVDITIYNSQWAMSIKQKANVYITNLLEEMKLIFAKTNSALKPEQAQELFVKVRKGVIIRIIQTEYQEALSLLDKFASIVEFSTQPKVRQQFLDNRFIEYLFLKYIGNLFSLIWFPLDDNKYTIASGVYVKEGDKLLYSSSSFKPMDRIYNQVLMYQKKNESLFEENDDETRYFWIIRFLRLSLFFKQFEFIEFYKEFLDLFILQKEPLQYLVSDTSLIKCNLLVMFGMVLIFVKPFNTLSLLDNENDNLLELYYEDPNKIEFKLYNQLMKPLSNGDFHQVKHVFEDTNLVHLLVSYLEYNFPISTSKFSSNSSSFVDYIKLIIDLKTFLSILSSTRAIPRLKMLSLMGYDLKKKNESELNEVSNHLIGVISALGLGQVGIGYLASEQVFYNNATSASNSQVELVSLQEDIDRISHNLQGDSLATLMTNSLLEKFYS
ncbi:hypothetical protein KGF56_000996 [Candida oxycetoniae]|uniref:Uncharacterized protein n=1 Tax=Candida oxycetoniae TaxID=497107 RepID=A0AAI9T045_9ASCO|nr:uncharacterized protein KGF56_000996 [Candida oxycetoniae]KAI3406154.2 hypothetical protein KGF56_000996 [Candida oxycetoniae]